ncbi:EAL domain-containing protein [Lederbergia panacisoli]|uniref:EAL domain-containing protein n=1 Tax=Lederbergia panacisoli TaxID=1255251 RepID=UPI00214BA3EA|nr:EAL domain-containing protein [Lederbergia panacisoli]MCR2821280.1 EAL domain-containing protein [Lederbergia panacisoli]
MVAEDKVNLLLVDDRPENLLALEAIIERDDYNLIKAFSGEEALKYLLKYDFAAILLDVQMPGIDGIGTAKIIKAREKTKNIPILFITANNMDSEHIFAGYSVGAIDYILKPFDPFVLKAKVDGFVDIYRMKQNLIRQAEILEEKTRELEKANKELSLATTKLRISEALANIINDTSIDSMIIVDGNGLILKVNPAVRKMFFYEEPSILGKHISTLFACESSKQIINHTLENIQSPMQANYLKEVKAKRMGGNIFPAEIQIGTRYVQNNYFIAITIRDISERIEHEELIKYMAFHDALTDLPNKRQLNIKLTEELNESKNTNQPLGMMYLNIDKFKNVNDSLGHIIGDNLLKEIAKRLKENIREQDFVARVGGDEFTILLPNTDREDALQVAENLLEAFKKPFIINHYELFATTCIGLSIFPYDGEDLLRNADAALNRAKEQGNNRYRVYHSGMNIQSYRSFMMQNDLRKAIENDEFSLVYQPRVEINSGKVNSAETLIRWNHPSWGTILPLEFLPLAEETGFIVEIGEWVLKTVCEQINSWKRKGLPLKRIGINFPTQLLIQKNLLDSIRHILETTGIAPDLLEIELRESAILLDEAAISFRLDQLRKMGLHISIDQYGMGHLSLNDISRLPVGTLKLDKSLIQDISRESSPNRLLTSTIIRAAQNLNLNVIAEGVETEEQWNFLKQNECNEIQGNVFSPPISIEEFETLLFKQSNQPKTLSRKMVPIKQSQEEREKQDILQDSLNRIKEQYSISSREMDVFELILNGLGNKEIAVKLFISEHTVKNHITRIFQKLKVNDRLQAMAMVYQLHIEDGDDHII